MPYILRRSRLGNTSCKAIKANSQHDFTITRDPETIPNDTTVFRWGCTATIPGEKSVINSAAAIHLVNDKLEFRKKLQEKELCPDTWWQYDGDDYDRWPVIVRPRYHHQGRHLYVVNNRAEFLNAINRCGEGWYASEFIDKVAEYRVFVVQGRCVCVAKKTPANPGQVAWNVFQGGRFDNVRFDDWPLKAVRVSIEAFSLSGLDFGGVDIMVDREENGYVLEINSAPSLTSPYRQSCFAKAFDWIVDHGKGKIPLIEKKGDWKKFVHPSVSDRAVLKENH